MKTDRFWKLLAVVGIMAVLYCGSALHRLAGGPSLTRQARAELVGGAMTVDAEDVLITSSEDGKTLYVWTFGDWDLNPRRVPVFKGQVSGDE